MLWLGVLPVGCCDELIAYLELIIVFFSVMQITIETRFINAVG